MLANFGNLINEKLKSMQIQLRSRDERIRALETENAMLYLKLAQVQGLVYDGKRKSAHQKRLNGYDENCKQELCSQINVVANQFQSMKQDFESLRDEVKNMPTMLNMDMCTEDEKVGFNKAYRTLTSEQMKRNGELHQKLCEAESALSEAKRRADEERTRRRDLHNTLVELRGNIRVYCRVRPLLPSLDSNNDPSILGVVGTQSEQIIDAIDDEKVSFKQINTPGSSSSMKTRTFEYEKVFGTTDEQGTVFTDVAPLLTSLLDGYNVCIMAYGQTGSGKTHTMLGNHALYSDVPMDSTMPGSTTEGVIPRSAREIIRLIKERESPTETYSLEVSVFEIYNNDVVDLLVPSDRRNVKHAVFSASDGSQEIPSLTTKKISTAAELMEYVVYGLMHRHEDCTKIHAHSSRSHLIVQLNIYRTNVGKKPHASPTKEVPVEEKMVPVNKPSDASKAAEIRRGSRTQIPTKRSKSPMAIRRTSPLPHQERHSRSPSPPAGKKDADVSMTNLVVKTKLQLVDLAGSECVGMSGVTGNALRETSNINKSLSALADVLQALAENQQHIPYRNTKLTHVLQDTIGGDSKLLVMLCVSPVQKYCTESLQGLGFGTRARQVARGPAKKRKPAGIPLQLPSLTRNSVDVTIPRHVSPVPKSPSLRR